MELLSTFNLKQWVKDNAQLFNPPFRTNHLLVHHKDFLVMMLRGPNTRLDFHIEPGAMWEDFKVGMEHLTRWERMAVVTDVDWIKHTMRFFSFMMPGEMKAFPRSEAAQARAWVTAS